MERRSGGAGVEATPEYGVEDQEARWGRVVAGGVLGTVYEPWEGESAMGVIRIVLVAGLLFAAAGHAVAQGADRITVDIVNEESGAYSVEMVMVTKIYNGNPDMYEHVLVECLGYFEGRVVAELKDELRRIAPWQEVRFSLRGAWQGSAPTKAACRIVSANKER